MKDKEIIFSRNKMIIFGLIIDLLVSFILSYGGYDIINAFYGEIMPIERGQFFKVLFPGVFIIVAALIISYTLLSVKFKKKIN